MSQEQQRQMETPLVGEPMNRVDGHAKVTGDARYAGDTSLEGLVYGVLIISTIPSGRVLAIDSEEVETFPGVLAVLTPANAPRLPHGSMEVQMQKPMMGADRRVHLLQEDTIYYSGQPVGVVIAETFEQATYAAQLAHVSYETHEPVLDFIAQQKHAYKPSSLGALPEPVDSSVGDVDAGLKSADVIVEEVYQTQVQTHNPMEPHSIVAVWYGDHLTLHDSTQGIFSVQQRMATLFDMKPDHIHVLSTYTGGAFGSKGSPWSHVGLAALAARQIGRPVKLVLARQQVFGPVGIRGEARQTITLGAKQDGELTAIRHETVAQTSLFDEFVETAGVATRLIYQSPNIATSHRMIRLNMGTPTYARAPGEAPGMFALESTLDELAYKLDMDPLELRLRNYAKQDPTMKKPWSSKSLRECYLQGAERFGWSARNRQPGVTRDGNALVGFGMATATYPAITMPASARARLDSNGIATVQSGTQEIGTGNATVMSQIAADALGVTKDCLRFEWGSTDLPPSPLSVGSWTASSTGSAVYQAAHDLRNKLIALAIQDSESPLYNAQADQVKAHDGRLFLDSDPNKGESSTTLMQRHHLNMLEANATTKPGLAQQHYSMHAFGAHFAEVRVDADLGTIHVARFVSAFGIGRVLNVKTARSQLRGGIVWGIGLALLENTVSDPRYGRIVNNDLAEYHVPVNADVQQIEIILVDEDDPHVNPIGVKGAGEIGMVGAAGAIANAVYHATRRRIHELPITLDKLL
jgi:xanthine dehydrogenase YagR molybdenum-binding subunit